MATSDQAPPVILTDEMKQMITRLRLCYVATASREGEPNLSPKGSLKVLDDSHLAFADMASPQTIANLRVNPRIEINIVDPILRRGFRFKGQAVVSQDAELMRVVGEGLGADYPIQRAVSVAVEKAAAVQSPVYMFTDQTEESIKAQWLQIYGFR